MQFFTPELYLQFNSPDEREADRADEAWEKAIRHYKRYLKDHRAKMPATVRTLAEKSCLHDALLVGWQMHEENGSRPTATVCLQHESETIVLFYFLSTSIKESKRRKNWPFSQEQKHWLYDEVSLADDAEFVHRILWSDGTELQIPFADVVIDRFPSLSLEPA